MFSLRSKLCPKTRKRKQPRFWAYPKSFFNETLHEHDHPPPENDIDALVLYKTYQNLFIPKDKHYAPNRAKPSNRGFGLIPNRFNKMKPFNNMTVTLRGTTLTL